MKANKCGFSLIEMMVVLAIVGTISAFSFPNLLSRIDTTTQETKLAITKQFFNQLIIKAKRSNQNIFVSVDDGKLTAWTIEKTGKTEIQSMDSGLKLRVIADGDDLNSVKRNLNVEFSFDWAVFAGGEYIPLNVYLETDELKADLIGDGINLVHEK